jgi:hypothetical protein
LTTAIAVGWAAISPLRPSNITMTGANYIVERIAFAGWAQLPLVCVNSSMTNRVSSTRFFRSREIFFSAIYLFDFSNSVSLQISPARRQRDSLPVSLQAAAVMIFRPGVRSFCGRPRYQGAHCPVGRASAHLPEADFLWRLCDGREVPMADAGDH